MLEPIMESAKALPVRMSVLAPIVGTISLGVGLSGPFGTYEAMPAGQRLIYWTVAIVGAVVLFHAVMILSAAMLPRLSRATQLLAVASPVFVAIFAPGVHVTNEFLFAVGDGTQVTTFFEKVVLCLVLTYGVCLSVIVFTPDLRREPGPAFLDELPQQLGREVIRVQAADRQIEVVTRSGKAVVPMRLADALAELATLDGTQVHRAHWIAWDAVEEPIRVDGKLFLAVSDGSHVPVSRARRDVVEGRGFMFPVGEPGRPARARQS